VLADKEAAGAGFAADRARRGEGRSGAPKSSNIVRPRPGPKASLTMAQATATAALPDVAIDTIADGP